MSKQYCTLCRSSTLNSVVSVPKDPQKRKRWSQSAGVELSALHRICDKHFKSTDFYFVCENTTKRRRLISNALPQRREPEEDYTVHNASTCGVNQYDFNSQTEYVDILFICLLLIHLPYRQDVINSGIALENMNLQRKVAELKKENDKLHKKVLETQMLRDSLRTMFTESQIRKLENGRKRVKWTQEDISNAISLHTAGPRAYDYLIKKGFPLPGISTLDKWLQTVDMKPGLLDFAIDSIFKTVDMDDNDKICILTFDEMKLTSTECSQDYVLVVMAQGLRTSWKQPIYFDFGKAMSVPTLRMLIQKLYTIGYDVVGIVSDMGPGNQKLWSNLEVSLGMK